MIDGVLDYSIRVSSREAYVSPTRGAQGNALKTIMPMGYVLDERGEEASSVTLIEAHGVLHRVKFAVDHILQAAEDNANRESVACNCRHESHRQTARGGWILWPR